MPSHQGKQKLEFYRYNKILISISCKKSPCLAKKNAGLAMDKISLPVIKDSSGNTIPKSGLICVYLEGAAKILEDEKLNQMNFCQFKDDSLMEL
jgi:hypothetical protein